MKQWFDEKLAAALYDVAVPDGLAERLLARLADENEEAGVTKEELPIPRSLFRVPHFSRRRALIAGGLAATAAVLLVAAWLGMNNRESLSEQLVLDEAIRLFDRGIDQPQPMSVQKQAPADYPFSQAVMHVRGTRLRPLDGPFLGRRGVVYDLPSVGGAGAALFVVEAEAVEGCGDAPTWHPFTTSGCCASAWQEGRLLYVLVVQGDPATYRAYLKLPHGPVA